MSLHCGACMDNFENTDELSKHLKSCPAARALYLPIMKVWFAGEDKVGHPVGSLIYLIHKNIFLIKRYAYCIADEMNSLDRAKIHHELCEKLDIDYKTFKSFESSDIKKLPTREEAEEILWDALGEKLRELFS